MQRHTANYLEAFGYDESDTILCECCGVKAVDIHHIDFRSSFGSKRKDEQDHISNLIALCRPCHDEAHGYQSRMIREVLKEIVRKREA